MMQMHPTNNSAKTHLRATHAALSSVVPLNRTAASNSSSDSTHCLSTSFGELEQCAANARAAYRQAASYHAHHKPKTSMPSLSLA
jgi:hypothetical protein